jgi:hypothetical protein
MHNTASTLFKAALYRVNLRYKASFFVVHFVSRQGDGLNHLSKNMLCIC